MLKNFFTLTNLKFLIFKGVKPQLAQMVQNPPQTFYADPPMLENQPVEYNNHPPNFLDVDPSNIEDMFEANGQTPNLQNWFFEKKTEKPARHSCPLKKGDQYSKTPLSTDCISLCGNNRSNSFLKKYYEEFLLKILGSHESFYRFTEISKKGAMEMINFFVFFDVDLANVPCSEESGCYNSEVFDMTYRSQINVFDNRYYLFFRNDAPYKNKRPCMKTIQRRLANKEHKNIKRIDEVLNTLAKKMNFSMNLEEWEELLFAHISNVFLVLGENYMSDDIFMDLYYLIYNGEVSKPYSRLNLFEKILYCWEIMEKKLFYTFFPRTGA